MKKTGFNLDENVITPVQTEGADKPNSDAAIAANLALKEQAYFLPLYLLLGILFGVVLTKGEIISWFRIQEMFRLDSFHMYGVIGSAIAVSAALIGLLKLLKVKSLSGQPIGVLRKSFSKGNVWGGLLFGCGWAITGACPGPLFAQVGAGYSPVLLTLLGALLGTWIYGVVRKYLPH